MKRMHNNCGEIFSGFCRKPVRISELVWTTCCEINEFKVHSFPIFQRSSRKWQWERAWGRWHGRGRTEGGGEGVGHISVKIILTAFCMHLTLLNQVDVHVEFCSFSLNSKEKVQIFDFSNFNSSSEIVRSRCTSRFLSIQHSEIFLEILRIVWQVSLQFKRYLTV